MRFFILFLSALLLAGAADAQTGFPNRPIHILTGFPPSAAPDVAARVIGEHLSRVWNVPVIVENVPGASGNIATERVSRAEPDGYTLLMAGSAAIVVNVSLFDKLPYDPIKSFAPISQVCFTPNVLVVPKSLSVKNVQDLVALARKEPGKLTFGSAGVGTSQHLAGELFKSTAKIDILHVPYRGGPAVIPDLLGGRLTMNFANISNALPLVRDGKLRALAVTSLKRSPSAPDVPTMAEAGFPGFDATVWFGLMAPAKTPASIVAKIHDELVIAIAAAKAQKVFFDLGMVPVGGTPEEFSTLIKAEIPRWKKLIDASGAQTKKVQ